MPFYFPPLFSYDSSKGVYFKLTSYAVISFCLITSSLSHYYVTPLPVFLFLFTFFYFSTFQLYLISQAHFVNLSFYFCSYLMARMLFFAPFLSFIVNYTMLALLYSLFQNSSHLYSDI